MKIWNVEVVLTVYCLILEAVAASENLWIQNTDLDRDGPWAYSDSLLARLPNDVLCQNKSRSCRNCNVVNECAFLGGSYHFNTYSTCPDQTPYCNDGQCTTKPASDNCLLPSISKNFTCFNNSDGYFPAPDDCRKYYICLRGDAYEYKCPEGHVYLHSAAMCVRQTSQSQCFTFSCSGKVGEYLLYAPDETVYAYCRNAFTSNAWLFRCPKNHRLRPDYESNTASCEIYCQAVGRLEDPENSRRYWECRRVGNRVSLEPVLQTCPPAMVYNDPTQRCVVDSFTSTTSGTLGPTPTMTPTLPAASTGWTTPFYSSTPTSTVRTTHTTISTPTSAPRTTSSASSTPASPSWTTSASLSIPPSMTPSTRTPASTVKTTPVSHTTGLESAF